MDTTYLPLPLKGLAEDIASVKLDEGYASDMDDWVVYPDRIQARGAFGNSAEFTFTGTKNPDGCVQHPNGRVLVVNNDATVSIHSNSALNTSYVSALSLPSVLHPRASTNHYLWSWAIIPPTAAGSVAGLDTPIVDFSEVYLTLGAQPKATTSSVAGVPATWVWGGAYCSNINSGTVTVTRGSTTLTGSGTSWTNTDSGADRVGGYVWAIDDVSGEYSYVGRIYKVNSGTSITLAHQSPVAATAKAYMITAFRRPLWSEANGVLTTSTGSAVITGSGTLFTEVNTDELSTYGGVVVRLSDMKYVGRISSVTNNTSITLTANAAIEMNAEPFAILRLGLPDQLMTTGYISRSNDGATVAQYAGRTWFGNTGGGFGKRKAQYINQLAILVSPANGWPDAAEFSIILPASGPNDAIQQLLPLDDQLIVFTEYAVWAVTGRTLGSFETHKLYDDGALRPRAAITVGNMVAWAGRRGAYLYTPGSDVQNVMAPYNLRSYRTWANSIASGDNVWMQHFDKYITITTGNTSTVNALPYVIDYVMGAVLRWTNCSIRGKCYSSTGKEILVGARASGVMATDVDTLIADNVTATTIDAARAFGSAVKGPTLNLVSQTYDFGTFDVRKEMKEAVLNANVYYDSDPQLSFNGMSTLTDTTYALAKFDKASREHHYQLGFRSPTYQFSITSDAVDADSTRTLMKLFDVGVKARSLRTEAVRKTGAV